MNFNRILKQISFDDMLDGIGLMRRTEAPGAGLFILGLGMGLVGGAAAALLLTPYSGSETREKLAQAGGELGRTLSSKVGEVTRSIQGANGSQASIGSGSTMGSSSTYTGSMTSGSTTRSY